MTRIGSYFSVCCFISEQNSNVGFGCARFPGGLDAFYQGRDICKEAATQLNAQCTMGSENSRRSILLDKMQELNAKTKATSSLQAEFWSQSFINALAETESIRSLLDGVSGGPTIPTNNDLGQQLDMVFRLIKINEERNVNRDFFAVELGGFDTHFEMFDLLASKFDTINSAIMGFRNDLKAASSSDGSSLWDKVTVVMSSEFGRTVSPNNSGGTDHGESLIVYCSYYHFSQYLQYGTLRSRLGRAFVHDGRTCEGWSNSR